MSEAEKWLSIVDVIIPHPARPQLLVCQEADQWRLPQTQIEQMWISPIGSINHAMQRLLDLETTVLRLIVERRDETTHQVYVTYLLENHQANWRPPAGLRWVGITELDELTFTHPQQRVAVEAYLDEAALETVPVLRVPWARPGWQRDTETWIRAQLVQLGNPATGPIEQIKHWFLSCILQAPTAHGQVYFKVTNSSPLMVNEAVVTQALAQLFPRFMPKPLWVDPVRQWMLLADFGSEVGWGAPVEIRAEALRDLARLQIESAGQLDELLAIGCIDRRLAQLAEQIDPLLNDAVMLAYVDVEKQQQLWAAAPRLKALCAQLDQYAVPATLVHGDMHMSNVARRTEAAPATGHYLFFDWSDACIAHPFLDLIELLDEGDAAAQIQLRDRYLAMWTAYEPMERLLAMWEIAYPLCALHQAVSYQAILHHIEPACINEVGWAMPFWFGKILESLAMIPGGEKANGG